MQTKIFSLCSAALLLGGLAGCSSSDDVIDNPVPAAVSVNAVGQAIDDVTAEMQSTIFNCNQAKSRTRATSDIDALIPKKEDVSFNNEVPSNALDITEGNPATYNSGGHKGRTLRWHCSIQIKPTQCGLKLYGASEPEHAQ